MWRITKAGRALMAICQFWGSATSGKATHALIKTTQGAFLSFHTRTAVCHSAKALPIKRKKNLPYTRRSRAEKIRSQGSIFKWSQDTNKESSNQQP